jgi:glycosyltransferase involved in cell wall biosynthesis
MSVNGKRPKGTTELARIAIVTPWFGADLRGGVEQQTWQLAHHLTQRGHAVDVLTTRCASFHDDWSRNGLRGGVEHHGLLTIRRFRTAHRDRRAFERVNAILLSLRPEALRPSVSPLGEDDARVFEEQNINSPALYAYLTAEGHTYTQILFMPYLYGPTLLGLPLVAERAYLQPCLHDESYAYLTRVAEVAHLAKGLLFNSAGEFELALRLFGPGIVPKSTIVGEGVEFLEDAPAAADRVGNFVPSQEAYVLYLGRQDPAKNVPAIVVAFAEFKRQQPASRIRLVLAGERSVSYGDAAKGIVDLGAVGEAEKAALLAHCRALVQPSVNESFSRVIYEAWTYGRPVVVHRACLPTASAVRLSGGGYLADSSASWLDALHRIEYGSREELDRLGALGRTFAREAGAWPHVIARYERAFGLGGEAEPASESALDCVRQVVGVESPRGIERYAEALAAAIRGSGVPVIEARSEPIGALEGSDPTLLHLSTNETTLGEPAAIVYHATGDDARPSRATLGRAPQSRTFASSPAARDALASGGAEVELLPPCVDPRRWDALPDAALASALRDGKHNLVYVGPVVSIEHLNQLLVVFLHYLTIEREARLTLVAGFPQDDATFLHIFEEVRKLELADRVLVARDLSRAQYQAIFGAADVFISLDEFEGTGIELIEAMWFDVPVLAYASEIVRTVLGDSGITLSDKTDLLAVAALAQMLVTDRDLRASVIASQRVARARFDERAVADRVIAALRESKGALQVDRSG